MAPRIFHKLSFFFLLHQSFMEVVLRISCKHFTIFEVQVLNFNYLKFQASTFEL